MRSRNIKPGFFKNEDLASLPFEARLLFAGLWCMADRKGRLEDRPLRIKAEIFPYDACTVPDLLQLLIDKGFIYKYKVKDKSYLQIIKFNKHQYPHIRESDSTIPAPDKHSTSTRRARLIPDVLNPSLLIPESLSKVKEWFLKTWEAYPKERRKGKDAAFKRYEKSVKTLEDAKRVARAVEAYLKSPEVKDGFVMRGSKWFAEWEDWENAETGDSQGIHSPMPQRRADNPGARSGGFVRGDAVLRSPASMGLPESSGAKEDPNGGGN